MLRLHPPRVLCVYEIVILTILGLASLALGILDAPLWFAIAWFLALGAGLFTSVYALRTGRSLIYPRRMRVVEDGRAVTYLMPWRWQSALALLVILAAAGALGVTGIRSVEGALVLGAWVVMGAAPHAYVLATGEWPFDLAFTLEEPAEENIRSAPIPPLARPGAGEVTLRLRELEARRAAGKIGAQDYEHERQRLIGLL
jgi:hypothetical protein